MSNETPKPVRPPRSTVKPRPAKNPSGGQGKSTEESKEEEQSGLFQLPEDDSLAARAFAPHFGHTGRGNGYTLAGWALVALIFVPMGAAVLSVERNRYLLESHSGSYGQASDLSDEQTIEDAWRRELANQLGPICRKISSAAGILHKGGQEFVSHQVTKCTEWLVNLPTYQLSMLPILLLNTSVFIMHRIPHLGLNRFLHRNFMSIMLHERFFTLFTSAFSNSRPIPFVFHQIALFSVGSLALDSASKLYTKEEGQRLKEEGLARRDAPVSEVDSSMKVLSFCIGAAFVSGVVSWSYRRKGYMVMRGVFRQGFELFLDGVAAVKLFRTGKPHLVVVVLPEGGSARLINSLGSSGMVYALFTLGANMQPESKIGTIFLPDEISINAKTALKCLLSYDILALLFEALLAKKWTGVDHAAHIGGAIFGYLWYHFSLYRYWEWCRKIEQPETIQRYPGFEGDDGLQVVELADLPRTSFSVEPIKQTKQML